MAFTHRCSGILAVAAQRALVATLLDMPSIDAPAADGDEPPLEHVLLDARLTETPVPSRLH